MKQQGYLIAQTKSKDKFFTASSAYDRPQWKELSEATVYPTAELAQMALTKLLKNGAYTARLVPVSEKITFEFPNGEEITPPHIGTKNQFPHDEAYPKDDIVSHPGSETEGEPEMVAADQEDVCPECGHSPCTCHEGDETEDLDNLEREGHGEVIPGEKDRFVDHKFESLTEDEFKMPAKPPVNPETPKNDVTAQNYKSGAKQIDLDLPAMTDDKVDYGDDEPDAKIKAPANVISELKAKIAEYEKMADVNNMRDDAKASFALTAAEAMKSLLDDIEAGTHESIKRASINLSSWMSPIVNNVPPSVIKYVYSGGKKPTLRDLFDEKRLQKKGEL